MTTRSSALVLPSGEALLEAMSESVYVVDRDRTITYWNPAAQALTGYAVCDVIGRRCRDGILNHVDARGRSLCGTRCPLLGTMTDGRPRETAAFLHHRDGHRVPVMIRAAALYDDGGNIKGAVEVFHDDSERQALAVQLDEIQQQAHTDPLTGLGNRRLLSRVLRSRRDELGRYGRRYAVLFADVDHFKAINDRYGHEVGDRVLELVAKTLRSCSRASDTEGRWGGEEFLLVASVETADQALLLADRLRDLVAASWVLHDGHRVGVTLSVGVALARPGERTVQLIERADHAMLAAKRAGRNRSRLAEQVGPPPAD